MPDIFVDGNIPPDDPSGDNPVDPVPPVPSLPDPYDLDADGWPVGRFVVRDLSPLRLAEHFLNALFSFNGTINLRRWNQDFYSYENGGYVKIDLERIESLIWNHLDRLRTPEKDDRGLPTGQVKKITVNTRAVNEVKAALLGCGVLIDGTPPFWIDGEVDPDPKNILLFENGYINAIIENPEVISATPNLFTLNQLKFTYNPWADEPVKWIEFLDKLWPDDPQSIETLGEWFGYCLTQNTSLQKMMLLVGPKRGGKGTIARVLSELAGAANVCSPTIGSLTMNFGLWPLVGKSLAIIGDARLSGRTDSAVVIERLLSISGEDSITIDRKNQLPITMKLGTRFMLLSNELPRFPDSSGAIASRFVVLRLTRSWYGQEQADLFEQLVEELPGITLWALQGLRRLRARGKFIIPDSSAGAVAELEELGSPITAWLEDCCVMAEGRQTSIRDLYSSWAAWCDESGRVRPGDVQTFARDMRASLPGIELIRPRVGGKRERLYDGIDLTLEAAETARVWRSRNGQSKPDGGGMF